MNNLQPVEQKLVNFNGDEIMTIRTADGNIHAGVKWVCNGLRLTEGQYQNQTRKLNDDIVLQQGIAKMQLPTSGGMQEVLVIALDYLPLWLAKINANIINDPLAQQKIVDYQLKAKYVLATAFIAPQYHFPTTYGDALRMLADSVERNETLQQQNQLMAPKAEQFDSFLSANGAQTMNEVAKCLGTGRNRLFDFLKKEKVLMNNRNPYQEYIERGYFIVIEKTVDFGGNPQPITQTLVTPKGVSYIGKLLNRGKVLPFAK